MRCRFECAGVTLSLLLAVAPGTYARLQGTSTLLYQVTPRSWPTAIGGWTAHPAGSWTVQSGTLTSTGKGTKLCAYDDGAKSCRYRAVIIAPYSVTTPNYAIETEMQFTGPVVAPDFLGRMVLRAHGTSADPGPALIAGRSGFAETCARARLVNTALGMCAYTGDLSLTGPGTVALPITSFNDNGDWHLYRVEVQGQQYRLFIDALRAG